MFYFIIILALISKIISVNSFRDWNNCYYQLVPECTFMEKACARTHTHTHTYIYNKYISYIYIFNSWNLDCDPWVSWTFLQNKNHQAVKKIKWIENRQNTVKKIGDFVGIFTRDCKCVSVWVYVWMGVYTCVGYRCVIMSVCVSVSEGTNAVRCFNRIYIRRCILIICYIMLFLYV